MVPEKVALVTGVPCTAMSMDSEGEYLAVGASDGAITVFATRTFSRVRANYFCRDMCDCLNVGRSGRWPRTPHTTCLSPGWASRLRCWRAL